MQIRIAMTIVLGILACPSNDRIWAQSNGDSPQATTPQATTASPTPLPPVPVVSRLQMQLALNDKVIDTIEVGDLLTVIGERGASYVIQTFNGTKGAVAKENVTSLAEAVPIYDALIESQPKEGRLYTLRAGAHWAKGANDKALADFNQAITLGYEAAHAFTSRGLFHAAMGEYESALADYSKAIEKDPMDETPIVNRASVYMSLGRYEDAIADYTNVLQRNEKSGVYYQQRAIAQKLLGHLDKAAADYTRAIELQPKDVAAHLGRGFLMFQMNRYQDAVNDFSKVIELAPNTAVAFNNRGYNYQLLKQFDKAAADYDEALKIAPQYVLALQNRGWLLTICEDKAIRNPAGAIESATALCEISQYRDVSDLTLLAAAYASRSDFETAIGWQEKVVELATELQKTAAKKILECYLKKEPLDPKLLEISDEDSASTEENADKSESVGAADDTTLPDTGTKSAEDLKAAPKSGD